MTNVPERTCLGCRSVAPASGLVRLVAPEGRLIVVRLRASGDEFGALPRRRGRGAWVHPTSGCVTAAVRARAFARAFKRAIEPPDAPELIARVEMARRTR